MPDVASVPTDITKYWDGMVCRQDPDRAAAAERKMERQANSKRYAASYTSNLERLRGDRAQQAVLKKQARTPAARALGRGAQDARGQTLAWLRTPHHITLASLRCNTTRTACAHSLSHTHLHAPTGVATLRRVHGLRPAEPRRPAAELWRLAVPAER